jgi:hypothetical protein
MSKTNEKLRKDLSDAMQQYYRRAYEKTMAALFDAKKKDNYWQAARQAQLLKQIAGILDGFKESSGEYLRNTLHKLVEYETELSVKDRTEFKDKLKQAESFHAEYNEQYVQQVFEDTFQHIAGQTDRMKLSVKASLRNDAQDVFRRAAVEGIPRKKAYRELRDKIMTNAPDFRFIDKAGKKWDTKTYLDMMTHTVMSATQRDIYANILTQEGHDLVKVTQNGATDDCKKWEGKILSLTGATKGYPTLQEATATGEIFHPRCRHRFVAYNADIDEIFKQTGGK